MCPRRLSEECTGSSASSPTCGLPLHEAGGQRGAERERGAAPTSTEPLISSCAPFPSPRWHWKLSVANEVPAPHPLFYLKGNFFFSDSISSYFLPSKRKPLLSGSPLDPSSPPGPSHTVPRRSKAPPAAAGYQWPVISALRPLSTGRLLLPVPPIPGEEEAHHAHEYPAKMADGAGRVGNLTQIKTRFDTKHYH